MRRGTVVTASCACLVAGALLAGCSSWSYSPPIKGNFAVQPLNLSSAVATSPANNAGQISATSGNFTADLASDYTSLAQAMSGPLHDYAGSDYFSRKSLRAAAGETVPPENNSNWLVPLEVPDDYRTELADGRARLVSVLHTDAPQRLPALAARAQVSYDCWVERMEQEWWHSAHGRCREQFEAAMAQLQGKPQPAAPAAVEPPPGPHRYDVYFEFDRSNLTPEGRQIVDAVAHAAQSDHAKIRLVGKADTVGTDGYNMTLSHHRADAVRAALRADGIDDSQIEETWVGLREPPVPTPPGVREPRNRVVEINLG